MKGNAVSDNDPNQLVEFTTAVDRHSPLLGNRTAMVPQWVVDRIKELQQAPAPVAPGEVSETLSNIRRLAKEAIDAAARNDPKEDTTCLLYFRPDGVPIGHDRLVATVHNVAWVKYFVAVNPRDLLAALSPDAKVGEGWVACSERMPPERRYVLAWCPARRMAFQSTNEDGAWRLISGGRIWEEITHWMKTPTMDTTPSTSEGEEQ